MGAALASTVLSRNGHVTVWNRTASKADNLVAAGAMLAGSAAEAMASTDLCIVCVGNYEHAKEIVRASADLSGKVLVQLSTGSPGEGEALQKWANERGARYLDELRLRVQRHINDSAIAMPIPTTARRTNTCPRVRARPAPP
jgi:3-hydroxyisobutyrate dehydrogenase-like beta-hydroxyacid dehydrogenase